MGRRRPSTGSWCHGEAGIALITGSADARAATQTWLADQLQDGIRDLSLCHGATGAAEALPPDAPERAAVAAYALERTPRDWPGGLPGASPALFRGTSGIAWWLLRVHDVNIPSPVGLTVRPANHIVSANRSASLLEDQLWPTTCREIPSSIRSTRRRLPEHRRMMADGEPKSADQQRVEGMPDAVVFDGYYAGKIVHGERTWYVLYTDRQFQSWMLIDRGREIGFHPAALPDKPSTASGSSATARSSAARVHARSS